MNRYQRISKLFKKKALLPAMSFVVFICQDFREFLVPLETFAPMIHLLHTMEVKLVQHLSNKFIRPTCLMNETKMKPMKAVKSLDVTDRKLQLVCLV